MADQAGNRIDHSGIDGEIHRKPLVVRLFHWSVVVLFAVAFVTAYWAFDFTVDQPVRFRHIWFAVHRLSGLLAGLAILVWLFFMIAAMARSLRVRGSVRVLELFHIGLGLACFALPVLPWIARSREGRTSELYALLPNYNSMSPPTTDFVYKLLNDHKDLADTVLALLALHIAGALFHRFILKDKVLWSMWFGRK